MQPNRIHRLFVDQFNHKSPPMNSTAEDVAAAASTVSTQQIYDAAWALAKRDWELNRLFNAWYYEI